MAQHSNYAQDRDLMMEAYASVKGEVPATSTTAKPRMLNEEHAEEHAEDGETAGGFDQFIDNAEKFVDAIGDSELDFLMTLGKDKFEEFMQAVKEEHGYRNSSKFRHSEDAESSMGNEQGTIKSIVHGYAEPAGISDMEQMIEDIKELVKQEIRDCAEHVDDAINCIDSL